MRLDHISYATSHDQLSDTVQRLGSRLGSAFVDGGVHPRFGTRNFTLPLLNGQYLEVVCPLDHPATETSAFGQAVTRRVEEGGGWLTWVMSTEDISSIEKQLERAAIEGHRMRPDGTNLRWKQLGILNTIKDPQLPFFIEWLSNNHPSIDGKPIAEISKIEICGSESTINNWLGTDLKSILGNIKISWVEPKDKENQSEIIAVNFTTPYGEVLID